MSWFQKSNEGMMYIFKPTASWYSILCRFSLCIAAYSGKINMMSMLLVLKVEASNDNRGIRNYVCWCVLITGEWWVGIGSSILCWLGRRNHSWNGKKKGSYVVQGKIKRINHTLQLLSLVQDEVWQVGCARLGVHNTTTQPRVEIYESIAEISMKSTHFARVWRVEGIDWEWCQGMDNQV